MCLFYHFWISLHTFLNVCIFTSVCVFAEFLDLEGISLSAFAFTHVCVFDAFPNVCDLTCVGALISNMSWFFNVGIFTFVCVFTEFLHWEHISLNRLSFAHGCVLLFSTPLNRGQISLDVCILLCVLYEVRVRANAVTPDRTGPAPFLGSY